MVITQPHRTLKSWQLFTLLFGTIIAAGWITAVGLWIAAAGPVGAIVAFAVGCLLMTIIGLCFAEMMGMFPDAGGTVAYAREAFGRPAAFAAGWLLVGTYVVATAYLMIALAWLLDLLNSRIAGPVIYTIFDFDVRAGHALAGTAAAIFLGYINVRGAMVAARLQDVLVLLKILVALLLVSLSLRYGVPSRILPAFIADDWSGALRGILLVLVTTPFWFSGFDVLPQALRERSSGTSLSGLGRIIALAVFGALAFYTAIILSAASLIDRAQLLAAELPTYTAFAEGLQSPPKARLVLIAGIFGVLTAWNALIFSSARLVQVLSMEKMLPGYFKVLDGRFSTPVRAIVLVTGLGIALGLLGRNAVQPLISASSITLVSVFTIVCAGVVKLRRTQPGRQRPYRVPGGNILPISGAVLSVVIVSVALVTPLTSSFRFIPIEWTIVLVWTVFGFIAWRIADAKHNKATVGEVF